MDAPGTLFVSLAAGVTALLVARTKEAALTPSSLLPISSPLPPPPPVTPASATPAQLAAAVIGQQHDNYVLIRDVTELRRKMSIIRAGGVSRLQILIDFDRTITTVRGPRGGRGATCHGILESAQPPSVKAKADALNEFYYPIEVRADMTKQEKIPYMEQWYRSINSLLLERHITHEYIKSAVSTANVGIRKGIPQLFAYAHSHAVPFIVFSAGVGDVLQEVIAQKVGAMPVLSSVISNWMVFNDAGECADFTEPLVHMFNKNDSHLATTELYPELCKRPNVVVIGDSLGDSAMADGLSTHELVLRVGILNEYAPQLAVQYMVAFDIVFVNEPSLTELAAWLDSVAASEVVDDELSFFHSIEKSPAGL